MRDSQRFIPLVEEIDFQLAQRRYLRAQGFHLIVTHLDHVPGTICVPGEMIGGISVGGFGEPLSLGFTHMSLLLMDCLCRYRLPLSAQRIEQIMNSDPFYVRYAANGIGRNQVIARPDRKSVRAYVNKIRKQMELVFRELGTVIDPSQILVSETTESNIVLYRLKTTVEVQHKDK
jgi:hypothetical protein